LIRSLESLHALQALRDDARLTEGIGAYMAELPVEPCLGRALLHGWASGCVLEVATIISMLQVETIWASGPRKKVDKAKDQFAVGEGDLITYLNVWKAWEEGGRNKHWCIKNFVSHRSLLRASDIRDQLMRHVVRLKKQADKNDTIFSMQPLDSIKQSILWRGSNLLQSEVEERLVEIRKCFTMGLFLNAVQIRADSTGAQILDTAGRATYKLLRNTGDPISDMMRLRIHPSSVLFNCQPQWLCYHTAQQTSEHFIDMQDALAIEPDWLSELAPHFWTRQTHATPQ